MGKIRTTQALIEYRGMMSSQQLYGKSYKGKRTVSYGCGFNEIQEKIYCQTLLGFDAYTKEEIARMSPARIRKVKRLYKKTWKAINSLKQQMCNLISNHFFTTLFPNSSFTNQLIKDFGNAVDNNYDNTMSFEELGLTEIEISKYLVKKKILRQDFFEIEGPKRTKFTKEKTRYEMSNTR